MWLGVRSESRPHRSDCCAGTSLVSVAGMPSRDKNRQRVVEILERLHRAYPGARLALDFTSPFELLIALILAAQCTDDKVNQVTGEVVFKKYRTPEDYVRVA